MSPAEMAAMAERINRATPEDIIRALHEVVRAAAADFAQDEEE